MDRTDPLPFHQHPIRSVLTLAMAVTVGIGIARFAYALVLPDMREDLAWSWSAAGFMNTINAIGYLVGALTAAALIRKVGWSAAIRGGTLACLASLVLCALSGNFFVLSLARLIAGLGAAAAFVAGGALTAEIGHSHPARASLLLALFYSGPGLGILLSGLIAPFTLQWLGPGSWQMVWWVLALLSVILILPVFLTRIESRTRFAAQAQTSFPIRPIRIYLAGYFLFGAGYIAYMTFLIAFVRDTGAGAPTQALLWTLIGLSAFVTPWVCRGVLALDRGGLSAAILVGANALGAAMPVLSHSTAWMAASAFVFGTAFFAVAASTTAFVRFNYPPQAWPQVIAALTVAFSLGQMLGPIAIGAITDALGSLSYALNVSAAILVLSALSAACQRRLR